MTFGTWLFFCNGPKTIGHFVAAGNPKAAYIKIFCPWDSTKGHMGGGSVRGASSMCYSKEGILLGMR